jgi:hypothetical protein
MVRRYSSKPRRGGHHQASGDLPSDSRPPITDDSDQIAPGTRDVRVREVQFGLVAEHYLRQHIDGGRIHSPSYDNG